MVVYIYRRYHLKQSYYALQGEIFQGRGFSWGAYIAEKTGLWMLLGSVLNECVLLTRAEFKKVTQGATVPGRMTVVLYTTVILPGSLTVVLYTTVNLPGTLTVVYIYRRHYPKETLICLARGSFPGKRVFLGGLYCWENGARNAFGEVS